VVLNYTSVGPYIFYGSNDGTLRGTKGGRISSDGKESWAFLAPEFFGKFNRLRTQTPALLLPGTPTGLTPTPLSKDYFFDGSMGSYQSTDLATEWIFATARRGGRFMYAFDVSTPTSPKFKWRKNNTDLAELGQTWSEPIAFKVKALTDPVVMFGAGYDNVAEDQSPAGVTTMGRGIYVLNANTGALVKFFQTATNGGSISSSVPSDVTVRDTDSDTFGDRAYVGDMAGNVWRMDIDDPNPANWKLFKFAALGTRKFFFPPDVIVSKNFDLVMIGSGDREKPLDTTATDKFYMLKDPFVGKDATGMVAIVPGDLTTAGQPVDAFKGWYLALLAGEKVINAPLSIAGTTFFSTNQPSAAAGAALGTCSVNLGVARAYAINSLNGTAAIDRNGDGTKNSSDLSTVLTGGGLPPSPVGGVVQLDNGKKVDFIIGSGAGGSPISPAIPPRTVPTIRKKVYWNTQSDT
jgi:type IV pilus assembly protein PilY1